MWNESARMFTGSQLVFLTSVNEQSLVAVFINHPGETGDAGMSNWLAMTRA